MKLHLRAPAFRHKTRKEPRPELIEFPAADAASCREIWLGAHLPQLAAPSEDKPGEERRRQRLLERFATHAMAFTPRVSLVQPDGLLLEVKGSLRLFGGAKGLRDAVALQHCSRQLQSQLAIAPTPMAALAFARIGSAVLLTEQAQFAGQAASLPLSALRWPGEVIERLGRIGVHNARQALRLPRAGFARRFGAAQLASLDRLMGYCADLRVPFRPRERFRRSRELSYEVTDHAVLMEVMASLLDELAAFLQVRQSGISCLEFRFRHRHALPTLCAVSLALSTADAAQLTSLSSEKLARTVLPEPARACELRTDVIAPLTPSCVPMWQTGEHGSSMGIESAQLIERLRARIAADAVYGLRSIPDHCPEKSHASCEPGTVDPQPRLVATRGRPLWMLGTPEPLAQQEGFPCHRGRLTLCEDSKNPERIEAGGWKGTEVVRDYYAAIDVDGTRLWVFRERTAPHHWFLHGVFG